MKLTVKDMAEVLSFLEIAQRSTESAIKNSNPDGIYHKCMTEQLERITALIQRIETVEI